MTDGASTRCRRSPLMRSFVRAFVTASLMALLAAVSSDVLTFGVVIRGAVLWLLVSGAMAFYDREAEILDARDWIGAGILVSLPFTASLFLVEGDASSSLPISGFFAAIVVPWVGYSAARAVAPDRAPWPPLSDALTPMQRQMYLNWRVPTNCPDQFAWPGPKAASLAFRARTRLWDIAASAGALPLFFCAILFLWPWQRVAAPGPLMYRQQRVLGVGREASIWKFRTMKVNAERDGARLTEEGDDRVFSGGNVLRQSHLDELPQILDILVGRMTLVGPRPERPELSRSFAQAFPMFPRRIEVAQGLTGLAQVRQGYASRAEEFELKLQRDLFYAQFRSAPLNLKIASETIFHVLGRKGR